MGSIQWLPCQIPNLTHQVALIQFQGCTITQCYQNHITAKSIAEFQLNQWLLQLNFALLSLRSRNKFTELHTHCLNVSIKGIFRDFKWKKSIANWCIGICFSCFTGSSQSMATAHEPILISWTLPNIQWQV